MPDFNVRSDAVNVEQLMEQIRARIREKRGVDYTEAQIQELASVKLEKFLDPRGVRSDLLEQFRRAQPQYAPPELPNYAFESDTLFASTRGPLRLVRKLLLPILKLFFNPNPLIQALNIQSQLNAGVAEREARRDSARFQFDRLHYEVMHNLVVETTRLGIEVKNLTMRLESLTSRLEFTERRARALESVVVYKPAPEERQGRDEQRRERDRDRDRDDNRRDENRREGRRNERSERGERTDRGDRGDRDRSDSGKAQQAPAPAPVQAAPVAQPDAVDTSAPTAQADGDVQNAAAGGTPEGPGTKSRRRRRRRGRRGSGSAAALMGAGDQPVAEGGDADDQSADAGADDDSAEQETGGPSTPAAAQADHEVEMRDSRSARPEPFEHTFGAQAHPAEQAASDPTHAHPAPASPAPADAPAPAPVEPQAPSTES